MIAVALRRGCPLLRVEFGCHETEVAHLQSSDQRQFPLPGRKRRVTDGVFETPDEAVAACRSIVDGFLSEAFKPDMSPEALYSQYVSFGDDPFICAG